MEPLVTDNLKGIFHCFGGTVEEAEKIKSIGFMMGIGGVVTFKNSNLPDVLKKIEINHVVLETDSPYLAPVPFRGKRNESSYLRLIANQLSSVYEIPVEEIAMRTSENACKIFNL